MKSPRAQVTWRPGLWSGTVVAEDWWPWRGQPPELVCPSLLKRTLAVFSDGNFQGHTFSPLLFGSRVYFYYLFEGFFFFCVGILKRALRLLLESMIPTCYYILLRVRFSTLKMKTQTNFLTWTRTFSYIHYCPISWTKVESNAHSHPPKETTRLCWLLGRSISFEDGLE